MTWYLGMTTSAKIRPEPGAKKIRGEFAVEQQLQRMGVRTLLPRRIDFIRRGKQRYAEPVESPALRGYIFAEIPEPLFIRAVNANGLVPTLMTVSQREMLQDVMPFAESCLDAEREARRIIERNDATAMINYQKGQRVNVIAGPFMDRIVKFTRMVERGQFPELECEMEMLGQSVTVRIDPLDVRAAK